MQQWLCCIGMLHQELRRRQLHIFLGNSYAQACDNCCGDSLESLRFFRCCWECNTCWMSCTCAEPSPASPAYKC